MLVDLLGTGLEYAVYGLEAGLFIYLLSRGRWKSHFGVLFYVLSLLAVDWAIRPYFFHRYTREGIQYAYCYWLTDFVLALEAFGLVCLFFRRACTPKVWPLLRLCLLIVFALVAAVSALSLSLHRANLLHDFIYEFERNLFFTCLVLNTVLYIMLQQAESADDELGLLVCGMGIQFAGPTVILALVRLAVRDSALQLLNFVMPICTLAMLAIWFCALMERKGMGSRALPGAV